MVLHHFGLHKLGITSRQPNNGIDIIRSAAGYGEEDRRERSLSPAAAAANRRRDRGSGAASSSSSGFQVIERYCSGQLSRTQA